jgi:hypothetical protein
MNLEIPVFDSLPRSTQLALAAGLIFAVLCFPCLFFVLVSFNHHNAQPYSFLNHTASELGFPGASPLTWLYNAAIVVASFALLFILCALGKQLRKPVGYAAVGYSVGSCLGLAGIGVLGLRQDVLHTPYLFQPYLQIHLACADVFFLGWLVAVALFTIVFCRQWNEPLSRAQALIGIGSCLLFVAFVASAIHSSPMQVALQKDLKNPVFQAHLVAPTTASILTPWLDSHRPQFWSLALLEWAIIGSIVLWCGMSLIYLWKKTRRA